MCHSVGSLNPNLLIRRESLTEQSIRAIREAILGGTYVMGQKLRESELVARFAVSSSVIRGALHVLQGQGIIVTKPYCGRSVFTLTPDESNELIVMRTSLESYAAYLAAQKITPYLASELMAAATRFITKAPVSYSDWVDLELGFHGTIWKASQNDWLRRQLNQLAFPTFALRILERKYQDVQRLWQECQLRETEDNAQGHQVLARAIAQGDAARSRSLMLLHVMPEVDEMDASCLGFQGNNSRESWRGPDTNDYNYTD